MSDKELIEKIEDAYRRVHKIGPDATYETELREVLHAAADALEASQPSENDREAFCIEHGNLHAVELGDPTCEFEDGFGEPVDGEKP